MTFNFNNLPNWVKWVAGILLGLAVVIGIVNIDSFVPSQESDALINVKFIVLTEEKNPVEGVKVQFIFDDAPEPRLTNTDGYVDIKVPKRNDIRVILKKDGYKDIDREINLKADPQETVTYYMEKNTVPYESSIYYEYVTAQNSFFPLIFSFMRPNFDIKIVKKIFSDVLDLEESTPIIYNNDVFMNIERFKLESSKNRSLKEDLGDYMFQTNKFYDKDFIDQTLKNTYNDIYEYDGYSSDGHIQPKKVPSNGNISNFDRGDAFCEYTFAPVLSQFQTNLENAQYTSFLEQNMDYGYISQIPKLSDIDLLSKHIDDLYCGNKIKDTWIQKIVKNNPDHRGLLEFNYLYVLNPNISPFGCRPTLWSITRHSASPYIKFIDIKNESDQSKRIGSIKYQLIEENNYKINNVSERNKLFKDLPIITDNIGISLKSNQHFFIPIEFGFNSEAYKKEYFFERSNMSKDKLENLNQILISRTLSESETIKMYNQQENEIKPTPLTQISISEKLKEKSSSLEEITNLIPNRFSLGQIINVNSIEINGREMQLDSPNDEPKTVSVVASIKYGSCPYLLVFNGKKWLELGTVLSDRKQQSLQQEEIYNLTDNVLDISQIKIEERESEISYIDMISILYTDAETKKEQEFIYPIPELKKADKNYYLLHQGESLDIDLENLIPANAYNIKLKINGYFEIL